MIQKMGGSIFKNFIKWGWGGGHSQRFSKLEEKNSFNESNP